ncbi:MAG TPA: hypothetical protein VN040_04880, partial [Pseudosphingobacterium sp.]|nr:hypothetical protein [Pseudosphingobacterium sp.]
MIYKTVYSCILYTCLFVVLCLVGANAQEKKLMATNLENIRYPFQEHYISLNIQGEQLIMEYMDVQAENPNGKIVVLLHGKNFNGAYWEKT